MKELDTKPRTEYEGCPQIWPPSENDRLVSYDTVEGLIAGDPLKVTGDIVRRAEHPELADPVWALLKARRKKTMVRSLPSMPQYSYRHNCPICGTHVPPTRLGVDTNGTTTFICGYCGKPYREPLESTNKDSDGRRLVQRYPDAKAGNKPLVRSRTGRFSLTVWLRRRVLPVRHGYDFERERIQERICLQYSRWDFTKREWQRQSIWFNPEELRDLTNAIEQLESERLQAGLQ